MHLVAKKTNRKSKTKPNAVIVHNKTLLYIPWLGGSETTMRSTSLLAPQRVNLAQSSD